MESVWKFQFSVSFTHIARRFANETSQRKYHEINNHFMLVWMTPAHPDSKVNLPQVD